MVREGELQAAAGEGDRAAVGAETPRKTRGRGLRTRTGCLTCRKRHVKCDETKPACRQCERTQKSCIYTDNALDPQSRTPKSPLQVSSNDTGLYNSSLATASIKSSSQQHEPSQSEHHRHGGAETGPRAPSHPASSDRRDSVVMPSNFSYASPASVENDSAYQPVGLATAKWFGMLVGDADIEIGTASQHGSEFSKSDPGRSPYELRGSRDDSSDHHFAPSGTGSHVAAASTCSQERYAFNHQERMLSERRSWQSQAPLQLQGQGQHLFDTFVKKISLWLDLFDPMQNIASLVPRLALYNVGLLNAILTLSARYRPPIARSTDELVLARRDALQYYHETLHYIRKAMQYESYHTSDELLATTIIISAYEMLDGSARDWERHLQGVFWIQRSQVIHGDSGGFRASIWWIWLCQDVWAAFRDRRKVFTFWKPQRMLAYLSPSELAARSVYILGRVVNYCASEQVKETVDAISEKIKQAELLSSILDEWENLLTPQFRPLPHEEPATASVFPPIWVYPPMYGVSLQVHHAARILILLHKPTLGGFHESLRRQRAIDKHVEMIAGIACTLTDYASSTLSSQCLYIAGLSTFDQRYRDEIVRLVALCQHRTGWPSTPMDEELKHHWGQNQDN